nr:hypothetical protein [Sphingobium sp. SCG-1]
MLAIGTGFADRTLPKAQWTHAAHFAACLWLLRCREDLIAERDMPDMIRAYNGSTGGVNSDSTGYHETITLASIQATRHFMDKSRQNTPLHIIHAWLMEGNCGQKDWLLRYWSTELLMSTTALKSWTAPDLQPLPF